MPLRRCAQTVDTKAAASGQQSKEVDIEADRMEILDAEDQAVFTGNVDAKRGDVRSPATSWWSIYTET